ncbi:hypothetical protein, partial [Brenneria nigrifluens]|uniref:hypothetical protein n=1 Tax=Brenneria nigrifluens TaxID=55210 RepID=UPI001B346E02
FITCPLLGIPQRLCGAFVLLPHILFLAEEIFVKLARSHIVFEEICWSLKAVSLKRMRKDI